VVSTELLLPGVRPSIDQGEIHVWRIRYDHSQAPLNDPINLLSSNERARAESFIHKKDAARFVLSIGTRRIILGHYLDCDAALLKFCSGTRGKPELAGEFRRKGIFFNTSRSETIIVHVFSAIHPVGIDVECIRPLPQMDQLARRFFSTQECQAYFDLPSDSRQKAFYSCWTRKEALVKAIGDGLYYPLDDFDVSLNPDEPARLLRFAALPGAACMWSLFNLEFEPDYVAALATIGPIIQSKLRIWDMNIPTLLPQPDFKLRGVFAQPQTITSANGVGY
jgi:4'-phosphopantetheinyl transferase